MVGVIFQRTEGIYDNRRNYYFMRNRFASSLGASSKWRLKFHDFFLFKMNQVLIFRTQHHLGSRLLRCSFSLKVVLLREVSVEWIRQLKFCIDYNLLRTDSTKINRPAHNIRMYWTNLWQPTAHVQQTFFEKTPIEVCSPHLYASFGTFYVKISQLFELQWVFEVP